MVGEIILLLLLLLYYFAKPVQHHAKDPYIIKVDHNTGVYDPYSLRTVCGFFNVPQYINIGKDCETGPTVFRPYPRRLESLTICRCHYKGSTFFSVIVKTLGVGPAGA